MQLLIRGKKRVIITMSKKGEWKGLVILLKKRKRQIPPVLIALCIGIVMIFIFVIGKIIDKNTPSKTYVSEDEIKEMYYLSGADENQIAIVMQDEIIEEHGFWEDDTIYLDYNFVKQNFNSRFYWDNNENVLIYTTPDDVIKADVGSREYSQTKSKNAVEYVIVKTDGSNVYIALDYVKLFSNIKYEYYKDPARLCITYEWNTVDTGKIKEKTQLRTGAGIKKDIITDLSKDTKITLLESEGDWSKAVTDDGYIGYVKNKYIGSRNKVELKNEDYTEPVYTNIKKDFKISMAWHMIVSANDNNKIVDLTANTKGMNVISPTWFRIVDNNGTLSSLADASYVSRAHQLGMEVWAMVDDQSPDSENTQVFTYTSKRENMINQLISSAIQYNLDGINVDFEYITSEIAEDYIQFLRELSVKCRNNGIVLSVDDKVPIASNMYYNRKEQGIIADYVAVMAYDEHWGVDSGAGSTASISWVKEGIENTVSEVSPSKVILGVPFYTRIWGEKSDGTVESFQTADMQTSETVIAQNGAQKIWLDELGQNYSEYTAGDITYRIWVEDAASIENKVKLISEYQLAGVSAWRLGSETPDIWNTIVKYTN